MNMQTPFRRSLVALLVRFGLSSFVVWWTSSYWWPLVGAWCVPVAGLVLAVLAEVPFHDRSSGQAPARPGSPT